MRIKNLKLFDEDRSAEALDRLKAAGYNPSAVLRQQLVKFALEKGVLSDDKKQEGDKDAK
jgi:hypothetical protein